MNNWTPTFQSSNAKYQVTRGNGVIVNAGDLTALHIGRGIYHELFRDHEWLYISAVRPGQNGTFEIEYLEAKSSQNKSTQGDNTTEVTEHRAIKNVLTFEAGEGILISTEPVVRPQGRRITIVTTRVRTEEPLED